jgi:exopolyphosphatase/guanosine-5'-triphosphate,3'-diphosphate pyrophosphatase
VTAAEAGSGSAHRPARPAPAGASPAPAGASPAPVTSASVPVTDAAVVEQQLGRQPRGAFLVAHRCPCGLPDVIETAPRLADGTPFPTLFYLTCPRAATAIGRLEAGGLMRAMSERLARDPELRRQQAAAHEDYLARRDAAARRCGVAPLPPGSPSAGGMPDRVKCLHALAAHELAAAGANPLGREALAAAGAWWLDGPCVQGPGGTARGRPAQRGQAGQPQHLERRVAGRRPVAAIDCGTNSLRLLIARIDPVRRRLADVQRRMEIVRLGEGVDATGLLAPQALQRTFAVLAGYAALITDAKAGPVRMVATSATRDADNAAEFTGGVREILGIEPEVLTGDQEALLSFVGATAELAPAGPGRGARAGSRPPSGTQPDLAPPFLVVDIGGGSTEFVLGPADQLPSGQLARCSVDIGCVRLTERHLRHDPPLPGEISAAVADIDAALDAVAGHVPLGLAGTLVGVAGSVTTVTGIALNLPAYDPARIHHARIPARRVAEVTAELLGMTCAQRAAIGVMHPGRADVIAAGALVLTRVMDRVGLPQVVASEHDILDGIAWSLSGADL